MDFFNVVIRKNDANYSKHLALLHTASLQSAKYHIIHSILNRKKLCA